MTLCFDILREIQAELKVGFDGPWMCSLVTVIMNMRLTLPSHWLLRRRYVTL